MRQNIQVLSWFLLGLVMSSCGRREAASAESTKLLSFTPAITQSTMIATYPNPQTSTPVAYPDSNLAVTFTPTTQPAPVATQINEQVYVDPEGWYAVNFPREWQDTGLPNAFVGEDGFFETGYLSEMMFVQHKMDVCQWIANIDTKNTYSVQLMGIQNGCMLTSLPEVVPPVIQAIIENPSADWPHRFLFIRTDPDHFAEVMNTFAWMQSVDPYIEPVFRTAPSRSTDITFWENTTPLPIEFSIAEYVLPEEVQNESPSKEIFLHFIPPDAPEEEHKMGTTWFPDTWEDINDEIYPFGYELKPTSITYLYELYKDGVLALDNIEGLPSVHHFEASEGEIVAFIVRRLKNPSLSRYASGNSVSYLVQNDSITKWEDGPGSPIAPNRPPVFVEDKLLWLDIDDNTYIHVIDNQHISLFSFATYFGANLPIRRFKAWNDHWVLEIGDFVIRDGEIINEKFDFDGVFDWHLINDKPLYFFRKGSRIGISYDGQFLPIYYHEVAHGYCCALGLNNPRVDENSVRFFGKRDGIWYYVIVEIN